MLLNKIDQALNGRNGKGGAQPASGSREAAAGVIGERFEALNGGLDQMSELARRFREFEALVDGMRQPLAEEFQARRDGHVELINLRTAHAAVSERLEPLAAETQRLSAALSASELKADELAAQVGEKTAALHDAGLDLDRLRSELSQAVARAQMLETSERDAHRQIAELTQDRDLLRGQLTETETRAAATEAARSQAARDGALMGEENEALKRRIDEVGAEVAALSRTSVSIEGQLASERARAAAEQADAARALRALESQVESARSEGAALTARLDTATARANRLETLNAEHVASLAELQTLFRSAERRADEAQVALDRATERGRSLETAIEESRQRHEAMETARLAAVDRAESLAKGASAQDKALTRGEDRLVKLQAQVAQAHAQHQAQMQTLTDQNAALKAELERVQADQAIAAAALEAVRRERGEAGTPPRASASVQPIVA